MDVILARPRGFCAGVDRAVEIVTRAIELFGAPVHVRHEIVHNRHVVAELRGRGAVFVDRTDQVPPGGVVIFSAHGVAPAVREEARARGLRAIDATCPLVTKVHLEAIRFAREGCAILLVGHRDHVEVEGTVGEAPGAIQVVETVADAEAVAVPDPARVAYLTQTTLSLDDTAAIVAVLRRRFPALRGPRADDICYATQNRQHAVRRLAARCPLVLVVGSPESSNTARLVEVASAAGARAHRVDDPREIDPAWLAGCPRVGLTAGASTPEAALQAVLARLRALGAAAVHEDHGPDETILFPLPLPLRHERGQV